MSSLVDYGSSDESVNDEDCKSLEPELPILGITENSEDSSPASEDEKDSELGLFSSLPAPKRITPGFTSDTDRLIVNNHKQFQKKQPVRITIPSLSEVNGNIISCKSI
jgi:hypothetical protein